MLEENYSEILKKLFDSCDCDLAVSSEWQGRLTQRGVIQPIHDDRRDFVRHHFTCRGVLELDQSYRSIPRGHALAQVVTRDVSRSGIALLHSQQLYPGELITLWLPTGRLTYVVERCIFHNDNCFEIGATITAESPETLVS